ncbi:hypothetical protein BDZ89DRAFT_995682 [Hymenopellis radicata]|nr:hypothetical protein BDZ89DRAFT_995682 [Hymenopellis radicata]
MTEAGSVSPAPCDAARPNKRPRQDSPCELAYTSQDVDFWFTDGNIVLIGQDGRGFRVHQGVLARNCEFFMDMFNLARPVEAENSGNPEVQTLRIDDPSDYIRHFMHYLYTPWYFQVARLTPYPQIAALLHMSTKYLCLPLRNAVVRHLEMIYRTDYASLSQFPSLVLVQDRVQHALNAIHLARQYNVPSILPTAFYMASLLNPTQLSIVLHILNPADGRRLLLGRARLIEEVIGKAWSWVHSEEFISVDSCDDETCVRTRTCAVSSTLKRAGTNPQALFVQPAPHARVRVCADLDDMEDGQVCTPCWTKWRVNETAGYTAVWAAIPSYFSLEQPLIPTLP